MEAILLCGIQATGKSTFCRERFFDTHIRINLDMLRTRPREKTLLTACLQAKQPFVVDNTNVTREERARYIIPAAELGFRVVGYYFASKVSEALVRNSRREANGIVPERAIVGTSKRFELPSLEEGFNQLFHVSITDGSFVVQEWRDDV